MMQLEVEVRKEGYYLCRECSLTFCFVRGNLTCPCCQIEAMNHQRGEPSVLIYVDEDSDIADMFTKIDFQAGD